jgi:outer membrane protein OmpA-like peptidoglycan-associated protein
MIRCRCACVALLTAVFGALGPNAARAQQTPGFYIGGAVGPSLLANEATTLDLLMGMSPATQSPTKSARFDTGFSLMASAGYAIGNGLRFEVEADYSDHAQSGQGGGDEARYGFFTNAVYDADLSGLDVRWVTPYLGVGIGYQIADWGNVLISGAGAAPGSAPLATIGGSTGHFAYQIIAGLAFPVEQVTGLSVTAEYRFMQLNGSRSLGGTPGAGTPAATAAHARVSSGGTSSFLLGLRYAFDADAPDADDMTSMLAPPPQPPPPSRVYIVYFDFGSVTLTPHTRDVIAEAVRASGRMQYTRVEVSGHSDASGLKAENAELSKARSVAVADEMVRWGIQRSAIDIHAWGNEKPIVKAKAGGEEASNRRVVIVYR